MTVFEKGLPFFLLKPSFLPIISFYLYLSLILTTPLQKNYQIYEFVLRLGQALGKLMENFLVQPTVLRIVRVARVGRVLRLVKG